MGAEDGDEDEDDECEVGGRNSTLEAGNGGPAMGKGSALGRGGTMSKKTDKEKKIGHRRVDEEGQITYKKVQTSLGPWRFFFASRCCMIFVLFQIQVSQIMGSIQLGISHSIGSLASKPDRDLLMQDFAMVETYTFPKYELIFVIH